MKNILPGTATLPNIELDFGILTISRERMLTIINMLNRLLTGRR